MKSSIKFIAIVLAVMVLFCSCSKKSETATTSTTSSTAKVSITLLNSKGEIQTGLEKIAAQFEKR